MSDAILRIGPDVHELISTTLVLPLRGVPTYHVEYGASEAPTVGADGTIELATGESFACRVARAVLFEERVTLVLCGGTGALSNEPALAKTVEPRSYVGNGGTVALGFIVRQLADDAGFVLPSAVEESLNTYSVERWHRIGGPASEALGLLCTAVGLGWRILDDGTLRMSLEAWAAYADEALLRDETDDAARSTLHAWHVDDLVNLRPGMTLRGRRIERVIYRICETTRAEILYQASDAPGDLRAALLSARRAVTHPDTYGAAHDASVAAYHNDDGTVDVLTGNAELDGADGLTRVPLRVGIARARQVLEEGARVRLQFEGSRTFPAGDPSRPFVEAIEQTRSADRGIARMRDHVRSKLTLTTSSLLGATAFMVTPWRAGLPRPDMAITITLGADEAPGSGVPKAQTLETDGEIITASRDVYLA